MSLYPFNYDDDDFLVQFDSQQRRRRQQPGGGFPVMPPMSPPPFGGGGQRPGIPPFGGGQFPGMPPFGGGQTPGMPPFGGGQMSAPTAPPPNFTPQMSTLQMQEFSRGGGVQRIGRCLFRNTFIWMRNGNAFWFYPMFLFGNTVVGFRWRGNRGWVYDSINRNSIMSFQCY